ncbi:MAG: hypothetical protein CMF49_03015 [Legionellales bacterium]|nr:hypothetical protein [Legionellales bacterium]
MSVINTQHPLENISTPAALISGLAIFVGGLNLATGIRTIANAEKYKRHNKEKTMWGLIHMAKGFFGLGIQALQFFANMGLIAGITSSLLPIITPMMLFCAPLCGIAESFRNVNKSYRKLDDEYVLFDYLTKYQQLDKQIVKLGQRPFSSERDYKSFDNLLKMQTRLKNKSQAIINCNKKLLQSKKTIDNISLSNYAQNIGLSLDKKASKQDKQVVRIIRKTRREKYKKNMLKFELMTVAGTGLMLAACSSLMPVLMIPSLIFFGVGLSGATGCGILSKIKKRRRKKDEKKALKNYVKENALIPSMENFKEENNITSKIEGGNKLNLSNVHSDNSIHSYQDRVKKTEKTKNTEVDERSLKDAVLKRHLNLESTSSIDAILSPAEKSEGLIACAQAG